MGSYDDMYCNLSNKIAEAIDELKAIQQIAEEMYMVYAEHNDVIVDGKIVF